MLVSSGPRSLADGHCSRLAYSYLRQTRARAERRGHVLQFRRMRHGCGVNGNCFSHSPVFHGHDFFPATTQPGRRPVDVASERPLILSDHTLADRTGLNHAMGHESLGCSSASALLLETGRGGRTRLFPTKRMKVGSTTQFGKTFTFFLCLFPAACAAGFVLQGGQGKRVLGPGSAWRTCTCIKITSSQPACSGALGCRELARLDVSRSFVHG